MIAIIVHYCKNFMRGDDVRIVLFGALYCSLIVAFQALSMDRQAWRERVHVGYPMMQARDDQLLQRQQAGEFSAAFFPLPESAQSRAVFHPRVYQAQLFCCGYNALFNACNFEHWCGMDNEFSHYMAFQSACLAYLMSLGMDPMGTVHNLTLKVLAQEHLLTRPMYNLALVDDRVLWAGLHELAYNEATVANTELFETIGRQLAQETGPFAVVHFICFVREPEAHCILLSVLQNQTGRGLYVFDNQNRQIEVNSPIMRFITALSYSLQISSRDQFKGPRLPEGWPSVFETLESTKDADADTQAFQLNHLRRLDELGPIAGAEYFAGQMIKSEQRAHAEWQRKLADAERAEQAVKKALEGAQKAREEAEKAYARVQAKKDILKIAQQALEKKRQQYSSDRVITQ